MDEECCICYDMAEAAGLHPCRHPVCANCTLRLVRNGIHERCPVCRAPHGHTFTVGVSSARTAALLDDATGRGVCIADGALLMIEGCLTAADLHTIVGTRVATMARLHGGEVLYGTVAETTTAMLDCFFAVPAASEDSRAGRALRRALEPATAYMLNGGCMPLRSVLTRLVFPVYVIDIVDPPELEVEDDIEYSAV